MTKTNQYACLGVAIHAETPSIARNRGTMQNPLHLLGGLGYLTIIQDGYVDLFLSIWSSE